MAEKIPQPTRYSSSPDLATFLGISIAASAIIGGLLLEGGRFADVAQLTAAMIVLGGTLGALLVTTPWKTFTAAVVRLREVFFQTAIPFAPTLDVILRCADRARKGGIATLEREAKNTDDPFLRKAFDLVADGVDLREIREILRLEAEAEEDRLDAQSKVWENAAGYSPTIGIIGAVLGLIQVMKHLENIGEVGRGIAVAFVATVYGVAAANILFLPAAGKLDTRNREIIRLREMMLEGVLAIAEGMNPLLIRVKLAPFVNGGAETPKSRIPSKESVSDSVAA